jgi:N-acyl homoserine lactone hydrolase
VSRVRRVVPLILGWFDIPRSALAGGDSREEFRAPVPGVLLECDGGWVLLDTGFNTALIRDAGLRRRFFGDGPLRPVIAGPGEPLEEALAAVGVDIRDIHAVAVSHLHWDHAGGLRHFVGRAPVHAQRAELDFATAPGPLPEESGMFRIDYDDPRIDWRIADGDAEIAPGVTAVLTAGHTPGHQSFVVDTEGGGGFVFAFDAAYLTHNCETETTPVSNAAPEQAAEQIRKLKRIAADRGYQLVPGHDPDVWPKLAAGLSK